MDILTKNSCNEYERNDFDVTMMFIDKLKKTTFVTLGNDAKRLLHNSRVSLTHFSGLHTKVEERDIHEGTENALMPKKKSLLRHCYQSNYILKLLIQQYRTYLTCVRSFSSRIKIQTFFTRVIHSMFVLSSCHLFNTARALTPKVILFYQFFLQFFANLACCPLLTASSLIIKWHTPSR